MRPALKSGVRLILSFAVSFALLLTRGPPGYLFGLDSASQVVVYQGSGHHLPYERREAVAAHLLSLTAKARASAWKWARATG